MPWRKLGRIFKADGQRPWMMSHTACPVPLPLGDGRVRIYFGTRDRANRPSVGHLTIHMDEPLTPFDISEQPSLAPGAWGMFDDNGVYPGCIMEREGALRLYYMGRSNGERPLFYMAIGIAESRDGGLTFERLQADPVMARSRHDPWMVSTPYVLEMEPGVWTMWYLSGLGWHSLDPPKSLYHIKVARSRDGLTWHRDGETAFDFEPGETNLTSPCIWRNGHGFEAVFCAAGYDFSYRLQSAVSDDGKAWLRSGEPNGLEGSGTGWDSDCRAYPSSFVHDGRRYLLYSGNENGKGGFGIAVRESP